ncbi:MAG TPA: iron-sulfur cluster-binding domain-containing protein [Dinghuibacter sp.]|uniref:iron-sulfur cluster-binding domain-containing protein n=1 Tax=Dinghuibacter sp. TaxID=2024697 RepID=UPI002C815938|nr:iron-sulfur cluster-binding domain-containing protein [Dinghuibacter sp.]HTJ10917.1 iron-sulfur cluster-binding domain-containing protein [Dinghuibacter sp.]
MLLRVTGRTNETHDTVTFRLAPVEGPLAAYVPGQFLTLVFGAVRRSFSLTSYPGDSFYAITVKRKVNGEVSRFLQDHIFVGSVLEALPPAGRFTFTRSDRVRDIGFIAAGSGIAPIIGLIRQALGEESGSHIWVIDQNHSEKDVIFDEELAGHEVWLDRVSLLSAPESHAVMPRRLNNANLETLVRELTHHDPADSLIFCCGPEALMRMAKFTLITMGFRAEQIRQEHFVIDAPPHPPLMDASPHRVGITMHGERHAFDVAYPANILQAALAHHIPLPYSCRGGRCSSCAVRVLSGRVVMSINDVLTEKDLAEGWVLTCTGYAATDVELEA